MSQLKRVVLDVLKPHHPNPLEFATAIAEQDESWRVIVTVAEIDEKTVSIILTVEGEDIRFELIEETINKWGASLHSIDEVEVTGQPPVQQLS